MSVAFPGLTLLALVLAGCADAPPTEPRTSGGAGHRTSLAIVCEADGTTSVLTPEVVAQQAGVHLVVENQLDEPASLTGGFGFDVSPGVSEWTLQTAPGDRAVACWPYSEHGSGEEPATIPMRALDPDALYMPPAELECANDEQWRTVLDFAAMSSGIAADPVDAVRRSIKGLESGDVVSVSRSGYPNAEDAGGTVVVAREGRNIAIFWLAPADDARWLISGGQGCATAGIDL